MVHDYFTDGSNEDVVKGIHGSSNSYLGHGLYGHVWGNVRNVLTNAANEATNVRGHKNSIVHQNIDLNVEDAVHVTNVGDDSIYDVDFHVGNIKEKSKTKRNIRKSKERGND